MTELYRRMVKDMQLRGLAERTQETYLREVRKLCEHVDKSPGKVSEEELREYFLHLKNEHAFSTSSMKIAYCGVKFFFTFTLKRKWSTLALVRARKEVRLPVVLEVEEVRRIVGAADGLHNKAFFCPRILLWASASGGGAPPGQGCRRRAHDASRPPRQGGARPLRPPAEGRHRLQDRRTRPCHLPLRRMRRRTRDEPLLRRPRRPREVRRGRQPRSTPRTPRTAHFR